MIGALNALTGRLDYLDAYIIGREKVIQFYRQLGTVYGEARRIYVVQDNWSIHTHPEVQAALASLPQIEPVWLPTYAPWLNPMAADRLERMRASPAWVEDDRDRANPVAQEFEKRIGLGELGAHEI